MKQSQEKSAQDMVLEAESGGRIPSNKLLAKFILYLALVWSLFQLYVSSPLVLEFTPWMNADVVKRIHLIFAGFLAYLSYLPFKTSPRNYVPISDWIMAFLLTLRIFSFITLILAFVILKAGLMYFFEKRNFLIVAKNFYHNLLIKFYDFLDYILELFRFGRQYKSYKALIYFKNLTFVKALRVTVFTITLIYIFYEINFINFISLSDRTSDVAMYVEWIAFLKKNYLYADNLTIGAYFFGPPIIIFFFQIFTNID